MVESISQRLEREKADLARLGHLREASGAGRNMSITFSMNIPNHLLLNDGVIIP